MWLKMAHFDMIRFFISDLMIDIDSTNNIPKIFEAEIPIMYECRHGIRAYKYRQYILDSMLHACMHACMHARTRYVFKITIFLRRVVIPEK